ncbi:MAG: hypothetical protein HN700_16190 [Verrucomicrobia bacterium]|jgi:sialate O-acetylesterase|nr:hypothetical protein [Verrucomicrobiota bacterium]
MRIQVNALGLLGLLMVTASVSTADITLNNYFSDSMVLQRDKPVKVWGSADKGADVTVSFSGQTKKTKADEEGNWLVTLDPMQASAEGREIRCSSSAKATADKQVSGVRDAVLKDVLVGDVWFFGRQTYADISLDRTKDGRDAAAKYKANDLFRAITIKTIPSATPATNLAENATTGWMKVDPKNALTMTGSSFYLGRDLVAELGVPIGIIDVNMNHHFAFSWMSKQAIDDTEKMHGTGDTGWLRTSLPEKLADRESGKAQEGVDAWNKARGDNRMLELHPLRNPTYPSCAYNAVISPLRHITVKGVLLQLGNDYPFIAYREMEKRGLLTKPAGFGRAWYDNYYIVKLGFRITPKTLPYIPRDWRRTFGDKALPFGLIMPPASDLDVLATHNREVRELQRRTNAQAKGVGLILPGMKNIPLSGQPADDKLLAQRCKQWVLTNATGPLFDRLEADGTKATVHFKGGTAKGLKSVGKGLDSFETAGRDGVYTPVKASIDGDTITLRSEGPILFVRYNWVVKPNQELVNEAGLPAMPFSSDEEWRFAWIPPPVKEELPAEYTTTADKWSKSNVTIVSGQRAGGGDSQPIPLRPGPLGMAADPFGPNLRVRSTERNSPADGKLLAGDIIYGVNGKVFDDSPGFSGDAKYLALADALTYSETEEGGGKLALSIRRGTKLMDVELQLQVMGSYSHTTPFDCEKSEHIVKNAEAYISERYRPEGGLSDVWDWRSWEKPPHPWGMLGTDLLFLMASGNPEYQGLVRRAIYQRFSDWYWPKDMRGKKKTLADFKPVPVDDTVQSKPWFTGYDSLILGEYYHTTGDRNVLPMLRHLALLSSASQIKPPGETPPGKKEAAQSDEQIGSWRQNYSSNPDRWKSGYGLMPHAGMPCVMGMQFAKEAGLDIDDLALKRGIEHFYKGRAEYGFVVYGYANLRKSGPPAINPQKEATGMLWSMNGKLGAAAALCKMLDGYQDAVDVSGRHCVYGYNRTRSGHGGMFFNNFWTPIGAWATGEDGFKHFMKGQRWWRELYRRHDGKFDQAGRGYMGVSYAIHYVAQKERLRILGAPRSAFGLNCPEGLRPAIEAHKKRDYDGCENLIAKYMDENIVVSEEQEVIDHLLTSVRILRASIEHDLTLVEKQIKEGNHYFASLELPQLKGIVAEDDPRLKEIVAVLESEEGPKMIKDNYDALYAEKKAANAAAKPKPESEIWSKAISEKTGKWQMRLVEHISNAPEGWAEPKFDDSAWNTAEGPVSWTMDHTALLRGKFNVDDPSAVDGVRVTGNFFRQANIVIHLNGELVAMVDVGADDTSAPLTEYGLKQLKKGENTVAINTRHLRRWGPARGPNARTVSIAVETKAKED